MKSVKTSLIAAGLALALAAPAAADMGAAPVGPGGFYGGFTVGYSKGDAPETEVSSDTPVKLVEIDPDGGLEGGVHFGHVFERAVLGLANFRSEIALNFTASDSSNSNFIAGGFDIVPPGGAPVPTFASNSVVLDQRTSVWDASLAFKGDIYETDGFSLPMGIELFTRHSRDEVNVELPLPAATPSLQRSDISAQYYGVMAVLEPELRLTEQFAVVSRLAGGIYSYDFDGAFNPGITGELGDRENGVGARAEGVFGLKVFLSSAFSLTLFGGVDYWSETPIANFPEVAGAIAFVDRTDMVIVKAGITATVAFGAK